MARFAINLSRMKWRRGTLRSNPTESEQLLWKRLKNKQLGFWFKRQVSFDNYVVDFYCPQSRLIIEIDGSSHISKQEYDKYRESYLSAFATKIIKFKNDDVLTNLEGVIETIKSFLPLP